MFQKSPVACLSVLSEFIKKSSVKRFFDRVYLKVIYGKDSSNLKPGIIIIEDGNKFSIMAENQEICSQLSDSEAIFFFIFSHFSLNLKLPSTLQNKNKTLMADFFSF